LEQTRRTCSHHARRRRRLGHYNPTLYERFSNKEDLLSLLRRRARLNLFSVIKSSRSPAQVCRRVLDFFLAHPNDYRLITEDWATAFARKEEMPSFEFLKRSLAARLGGKPDRHTPLALALVAVLHGTATLLHSVKYPSENFLVIFAVPASALAMR